MLKKTACIAVTACIMLYTAAAGTIPAAAMTDSQGADWAVAHIGQSIDTDGYYGAQCKDFVNAFTLQNYGVKFPGNATDLVTDTLPAGWQRIPKTAGFVPQPGDIALWAGYSANPYGHTAVIVSATPYGFVSVDQNWYNSSPTTGSPAAKVNHSYTSLNFWGVLRPPYQTGAAAGKPEVWKITAASAELYAGPGQSGAAVGTAARNTSVTVTEKQIVSGFVWAKTTVNGITGWLSLDNAAYVSGSLEVLSADNNPPVVTGVTDGAVYSSAVVIAFNEGTATLNGAAFVSGGVVAAGGSYTLTVTDAAGHTTTVHFTVLPLSVSYQGYLQNIGWQKAAVDGGLCGATRGRTVFQGLKIGMTNAPAGMHLLYRVYSGGSWQSWAYDGNPLQLSGNKAAVMALQAELTGQNAQFYSIKYRVYITGAGWDKWRSDGATAGVTKGNYKISAICVKIVAK